MAGGYLHYLMIGTTEGDVVMMDPEHWNPINLYHTPLKLKSKVTELQICNQGALALVKC
jgi:hypothetical protein